MGSKSILEMANYTTVNKMLEESRKEKKLKGNIYKAIGEYVDFLQCSLEEGKDSYEKYLIETKIQVLKKEQNKYYVPSVLEQANFDLAISKGGVKRIVKTSKNDKK